MGATGHTAKIRFPAPSIQRGISRRGATRSAKDDQAVPSMTDQTLGVSSAERPPAPEQKNRLQQRGFARAVAAPDQVVSGVELQFRVLYAAKVIHRELGKSHWGRPACGRPR